MGDVKKTLLKGKSGNVCCFNGCKNKSYNSNEKFYSFPKDLESIAYLLKESGCQVPEYLLCIKKKSKKEAKQIAKKAPSRDDITTVPIYDRIKGGKRKKFREIAKRLKTKDQGTQKKKKNNHAKNEQNNTKDKLSFSAKKSMSKSKKKINK